MTFYIKRPPSQRRGWFMKAVERNTTFLCKVCGNKVTWLNYDPIKYKGPKNLDGTNHKCLKRISK